MKKKVKLIKSNTLTAASEALFCNRKVESVVQCRRKSPVGVSYLGWQGQTENEFFVATFTCGIITLALDEREMRLSYGDNLIVAGFSAEAYDRLKNQGKNQERIIEYNSKIYYEELESLTFDDIMKLIGWKWKNKKHIEEDNFS